MLKNVYVLCTLGSSSSLIVTRLKEHINSRDVKLISGSKDQDIKDAHIVLLSPQIRYMQETYMRSHPEIPFYVIDIDAYSSMDVQAIHKMISRT